MSDFALMRQNMVNGQILPENITNSFVIDAFSKVPREKFVSRQLSRIAYMDAHFPLNADRFLLRPATLGRLLEALNPTSSDRILYIASGTGYGPALLSQMGTHVIALDSEEILTQKAERVLHELNFSSVEVVLGPLEEGWEKESPYEKMIIEGCIEMIPDALVFQLQEGGEIVTLRQCKPRGMEAIKYVKRDGIFTEIPLFDAHAPRLEAFYQQKRFIF